MKDMAGLSEFARTLIEQLGLSPHPEGGWYRRTWQSDSVYGGDVEGAQTGRTVASAQAGIKGGDSATPDEYTRGPRPLASLIYFLLPAGDASAWHVVDADEVWLWHGPGMVTLELGGTGGRPDEARVVAVTLGAGMTAEDSGRACGHYVIPAGTWQRTVPGAKDALVSCVVSPGFTYAGFELAE